MMHHVQETYICNAEDSLWFDVRPLMYNSSSSRFPPNTSVLSIISQIMVERWNLSIHYNQYYQSCAPSFCSYSNEIHTKTMFEVFLTVISMIGGISISLRLITPFLVKFLISFFTKSNQRQQQRPGNRRMYFRFYSFNMNGDDFCAYSSSEIVGSTQTDRQKFDSLTIYYCNWSKYFLYSILRKSCQSSNS